MQITHSHTCSPFRAVVALAFTSAALLAAEPHGWRGDGTGAFSDANPPLNWSEDQGIVWKTPTETFGNATAILLDNRIYVCSEIDKLICMDAAGGEVLWEKATPEDELISDEEKARREKIRQELGPVKAERDKVNGELRKVRRALRKDRENEELKRKEEELKKKVADLDQKLKPLVAIERPRTHPVNGYSSPTPTTDGSNIYVLFGTGIAAAYTAEGERIWAKIVQRPTAGWGHSASPLLVGGKLVLAIRDIFALDPATGKEVWTVESKPHWGSPVAAKVGEVPVVITCEGQVIRADTGDLVADKLFSLQYNSPMAVDGVVYTYDNQNARAHKLPADLAGDTAAELLWDTKIAKDRYYASPLLVNGLLYCVTRNSVLTVINAQTGEKLYEKKLDFGKGTVYPSPTLAGDFVFISHDNGTTLVVKPGPEYEEVGRNKLDGFRSCPTFVGDRIYLRGLKKVYCIGK